MRTGRRLFAQVFGECFELFSVRDCQYANASVCRQAWPMGGHRRRLMRSYLQPCRSHPGSVCVTLSLSKGLQPTRLWDYVWTREFMSEVFILGAGFSKAISPAMPLLKDLSDEIQ